MFSLPIPFCISMLAVIITFPAAINAKPQACEHSWMTNSSSQQSTLEVDQLLDHHRRTGSSIVALEKLKFSGIPTGKDVYNPTKPFFVNGRLVMVARVESRHSETDTVSMFFEQLGGIWHPVFGAQVFKMQDPFFTFISGKLILGGVETYASQNGDLGYRTVFYSGTSYFDLRRFAVGPDRMKDIRLVQLGEAGMIGVFTRPQGLNEVTGVDARGGRVGFTILHDLTELTPEKISEAPLLPIELDETQWVGVNEATFRSSDGRLEVLAHIAKYEDDKSRSYYLAEFLLDPHTSKVRKFAIHLERRDLIRGLGGESKRDDLRNVVFSGGKEKNSDGTAWYTVGAGDAEVHRAKRADPLL